MLCMSERERERERERETEREREEENYYFILVKDEICMDKYLIEGQSRDQVSAHGEEIVTIVSSRNLL